ncbi:MAG: DUF2635 domain-containing protein [Janthinobacterium lividum]
MDIVAVPGRLVRDPVTRRVVGAEPVSIDPTQPHWVRLLADGDVVEAPAAPVEIPATEPDHQEPAPAAPVIEEHAA